MFVLLAVHHRRILPLMSRPLRMDEMGSGVLSHDLEACRMSNEAPADEEVAARVRSAVAGDFQLEHVNGYPMKIDKGSINLVSSSYCRYSVSDLSDPPWHSCLLVQGSIDARSSKPPIKEDGVDRERRRESVEKQKYAKDLEKKKKEKKNLERKVLEKHRAQSRQRGESEEDSPDEDDTNEGDDDSDDSEGMAARLDRILEGPLRADVDMSRAGVSKRTLDDPRDEQPRESSPHCSRADTPPAST